jgi:hypothetical protein
VKLIETRTLAVAAASIEFTAIPQDGTDLVLLSSWRHSGSTTDAGATLEFNGITTGYSNRILFGNGSAASSFSESRILWLGNGGISTANTFGNNLAYIPNYTSSSNKSVSTDFVIENNATATGMGIGAGLWSDTAAITSLLITGLSGNLVAGSMFSLYKITKGSDGIVTVS